MIFLSNLILFFVAKIKEVCYTLFTEVNFMYDKLSNLIIKKVYSVTTMYNEKNTRVSRKNRPCWAIVIKYEGETVYYQDENQYISNINNMVILPKGCDYKWECTKSGHYSIIEFDCDDVDKKIYLFSVKNGEKILTLFKSLEQKQLIGNYLYKMETVKETYSVILRLLSESVGRYVPKGKEKRLLPVIEYISNNYNMEIKNDDLAKLTGLSTVYFRKLFTEVYGISPISYVKNIRIKKAKEMLRSDYSGITDIALSLGYSNIYDFSRDFKKHVGVSPSKFAHRP